MSSIKNITNNSSKTIGDLVRNDFNIDFEEYEKKQIAKLLSELTKILIISLSLGISRNKIDFCKNSFILRDKRHIYFPQLTSLYLPSNSIANL